MSVGRTWCYFSGAVEWFCYVVGGIVEISDGDYPLAKAADKIGV